MAPLDSHSPVPIVSHDVAKHLILKGINRGTLVRRYLPSTPQAKATIYALTSGSSSTMATGELSLAEEK